MTNHTDTASHITKGAGLSLGFTLWSVVPRAYIKRALEHVRALMREQRALRNEPTCSEKISTCYKHGEQFTENQRWQQVIFCKSKSSHKSFPCKSKSSHKSFPCKSKSSHKSFGQTSSQVKSQVIWPKHKSSHKSLCPSTSQVAHYFVQL